MIFTYSNCKCGKPYDNKYERYMSYFKHIDPEIVHTCHNSFGKLLPKDRKVQKRFSGYSNYQRRIGGFQQSGHS